MFGNRNIQQILRINLSSNQLTVKNNIHFDQVYSLEKWIGEKGFYTKKKIAGNCVS